MMNHQDEDVAVVSIVHPMIGCRAQSRQVEDCTVLKEVCFAMPQAEQCLLLEAYWKRE